MALRLLAVDNASSDRSAEILRRYFSCDVFIQNQVNVGFGRANNQLLEHVRADYVLLLNTDAFVSPETIAMTVDYMDAHPKCGILGVRLTDRTAPCSPRGASSRRPSRPSCAGPGSSDSFRYRRRAMTSTKTMRPSPNATGFPAATTWCAAPCWTTSASSTRVSSCTSRRWITAAAPTMPVGA